MKYENQLWVVWANGMCHNESASYLKQTAIDGFIKDGSLTWQQWQQMHGAVCLRTNITFDTNIL